METRRRVLTAIVGLLAAACGESGSAPNSEVSSLRFVALPGTGVAGEALSVEVELLGADGTRATGATDSVRLTVEGGVGLTGTTTVAPQNGLASFHDVAVTKAAPAHQFVASASGTTRTSGTFSISAAEVSATRSSVSAVPENPAPGFPSVLTFTFRDAFNNPVALVPVSVSSTLAGATLTPSEGVTDAVGSFVAQLQSVAGTVTLAAVVAGRAVTLGSSVSVAPPSAFRFVAQPPAEVVAGQPFAVSVEIMNALGKRVDGATSNIGLALSGLASLVGTTNVSAIGGLATFPGLTALQAGAQYVITASGISLSATSSPFTVKPAAPSPQQSTIHFATLLLANVSTVTTFTFRDAFGNPIPLAPVSVSTSTAGATLTPASGVTDATGVFVSSYRSPVIGPSSISANVAGTQWTFASVDAVPSNTVVTEPATYIGPGSAVLAGTVTQNGAPYSTWFEWSLNASFDVVSRSATVAGPLATCSNTGPCFHWATASGLIPSTPYFFRSALADASGNVTGATRGFTTGPGTFAPVLSQFSASVAPEFPGPCPGNVTQEINATFTYADADGDVAPDGSGVGIYGTPIFGGGIEIKNWRITSFGGTGSSGTVSIAFCRLAGYAFQITIKDKSGNVSNFLRYPVLG